MKIGIVGAGPAGLYFALLMKKHHPTQQIQVVEQNPTDATYGWGVVFSDRAVSFLQESDPESYTDIEAQLRTWDDQMIVQKGEKVQIDGAAIRASVGWLCCSSCKSIADAMASRCSLRLVFPTYRRLPLAT